MVVGDRDDARESRVARAPRGHHVDCGHRCAIPEARAFTQRERPAVSVLRPGPGQRGQRTPLAVHPEQRLVELREHESLCVVPRGGCVCRIDGCGDGERHRVARHHRARGERAARVGGSDTGSRGELCARPTGTARGREQADNDDALAKGVHWIGLRRVALRTIPRAGSPSQDAGYARGLRDMRARTLPSESRNSASQRS